MGKPINIKGTGVTNAMTDKDTILIYTGPNKSPKQLSSAYFLSFVGNNITVPGISEALIYRALLTADVITTDSGLLTIGKEYIISTLEGADDFANVGYVTPDVAFTATGTTPTTWASNTEVVDVLLSQPTLIVLEDNIGITSTDYADVGTGQHTYNFHSASKFIDGKTYLPISAVGILRYDDDIITLESDEYNNAGVEIIIYP